jgi:uncharacterized protein (TIGR03437 family)
MNRLTFPIALALALCFETGLRAQSPGTITTLAGNGTPGFSGDGGLAINAELLSQLAMAADTRNNIYILDEGNNRVRKVNTSGIINTIAGGGTQALIEGVAATDTNISATDIKVDGAGNIFLATGGPVIKIDTSGTIHFVTSSMFGPDSGDGGQASAAVVSASSIALDSAGNIYIVEINNDRIRKIDTAGNINTIAGTGTAGYTGDGGPAVKATLNLPQGVAVDGAGNVYFADNTFYVRKIDTSGNISTFAGNGQSLNLGSSGRPTSIGMVPTWVAADAAGNVFINDTERVWKVAAGTATTIAGGALNFNLGDGGPATSASLVSNGSIAVDTAGNLYIGDGGHYRVREVFGVAAPGGGNTSGAPSIAADGIVNGASFGEGIVSGSWATVEGSNLAAVTDTWGKFIVNGNLPTTIDGVSVTVGDAPAYVYYVSPTQINFIVPPNLPPGPQPVVVRNSNGSSNSVNTTVDSFAPAFFGWPNNQVVATRQDFSYAATSGTFPNLSTFPAKQGDVIILWGTGFGTTIPAVPPGIETPSSVTYNTSTKPTVTIGNVAATVYGAALAPGFAGLYQVAIQVPTSLTNGAWPVEATIGGVSSPIKLMLAVVGP